MKRLPYVLASLVVLVMTSACLGSANGGGWIGSANGLAKDKATFGFHYGCNTANQSVTGNLSYHDHGTGHRLVARLDETLDPFGNPIPCNTFATILPGISHACGVVKTAGGGVQAGDLVLLATLDGTPATASKDNAVLIGLFHPPTPWPLRCAFRQHSARPITRTKVRLEAATSPGPWTDRRALW